MDPNVAVKKKRTPKHKYFQVGTVISDKLEGNQGVLKRKQKRQRILDQFKDLDETIGYSKKTYQDIQKERMRKGKNKKWSKLKKIKKYRNELKNTGREINFG